MRKFIDKINKNGNNQPNNTTWNAGESRSVTNELNNILVAAGIEPGELDSDFEDLEKDQVVKSILKLISSNSVNYIKLFDGNSNDGFIFIIDSNFSLKDGYSFVSILNMEVTFNVTKLSFKDKEGNLLFSKDVTFFKNQYFATGNQYRFIYNESSDSFVAYYLNTYEPYISTKYAPEEITPGETIELSSVSNDPLNTTGSILNSNTVVVYNMNEPFNATTGGFVVTGTLPEPSGDNYFFQESNVDFWISERVIRAFPPTDSNLKTVGTIIMKSKDNSFSSATKIVACLLDGEIYLPGCEIMTKDNFQKRFGFPDREYTSPSTHFYKIKLHYTYFNKIQ